MNATKRYFITLIEIGYGAFHAGVALVCGSWAIALIQRLLSSTSQAEIAMLILVTYALIVQTIRSVKAILGRDEVAA